MIFLKYKKVFHNNKWQGKDILNFIKRKYRYLNTFQEKFIILCNIGYKI